MSVVMTVRRGEVIVDEQDYEWLSQFRWRVHQRGYVIAEVKDAAGKAVTSRMGRFILGLPNRDPRECDHINRDRMDHRRENLRIVTRYQGAQNRRAWGQLGVRGVTRNGKRFLAHATLNYKPYFLGIYDTVEEAGRAAAEFRAAHMPFSEDAAIAKGAGL